MGKRAPKLPVASAERGRITISDSDWQRIEKAYGQKLSLKARRDVHEKTQEFVDRAEFEQNAEPVSEARDRITTVIGAASSLRSAIDGGNVASEEERRKVVAITDSDWQRVEKASGRNCRLRHEGTYTRRRKSS
jgi:hypothetical protein